MPRDFRARWTCWPIPAKRRCRVRLRWNTSMATSIRQWQPDDFLTSSTTSSIDLGRRNGAPDGGSEVGTRGDCARWRGGNFCGASEERVAD